MRCNELQIKRLVRFVPLLFVALAVVVVSGCSQEEQVERKPASPPNAAVDFNGPENRVDATFQGGSPE